MASSYYPASQHVREQSRMTEGNPSNGLGSSLHQDFSATGGNAAVNRMRELTLPVNKTSGFAQVAANGGA